MTVNAIVTTDSTGKLVVTDKATGKPLPYPAKLTDIKITNGIPELVLTLDGLSVQVEGKLGYYMNKEYGKSVNKCLKKVSKIIFEDGEEWNLCDTLG